MPEVKVTEQEKSYLRAIWATLGADSEELASDYRKRFGPKTISQRQCRTYIREWKKNADPSQDIPEGMNFRVNEERAANYRRRFGPKIHTTSSSEVVDGVVKKAEFTITFENSQDYQWVLNKIENRRKGQQ